MDTIPMFRVGLSSICMLFMLFISVHPFKNKKDMFKGIHYLTQILIPWSGSDYRKITKHIFLMTRVVNSKEQLATSVVCRFAISTYAWFLLFRLPRCYPIKILSFTKTQGLLSKNKKWFDEFLCIPLVVMKREYPSV